MCFLRNDQNAKVSDDIKYNPNQFILVSKDSQNLPEYQFHIDFEQKIFYLLLEEIEFGAKMCLWSISIKIEFLERQWTDSKKLKSILQTTKQRFFLVNNFFKKEVSILNERSANWGRFCLKSHFQWRIPWMHHASHIRAMQEMKVCCKVFQT